MTYETPKFPAPVLEALATMTRLECPGHGEISRVATIAIMLASNDVTMNAQERKLALALAAAMVSQVIVAVVERLGVERVRMIHANEFQTNPEDSAAFIARLEALRDVVNAIADSFTSQDPHPEA